MTETPNENSLQSTVRQTGKPPFSMELFPESWNDAAVNVEQHLLLEQEKP